jgi:hypothetical protein
LTCIENAGRYAVVTEAPLLTIPEMHAIVETLALEDGEPLSIMDAALIRLGVAVAVTSLDRAAIDAGIIDALEAGASVAQVQEIISLVSGLGVHSLMASAVPLLARARAIGIAPDDRLSPEQQELWDRYVGDDPFWVGFERELPGFLRAMLLLSSEQFAAFFDYCAVPWKSGQVRARVKELAAMASDATPTHRFLPGFRLHLTNAVALGAGGTAIRQALAIAAAAPAHSGTR